MFTQKRKEKTVNRATSVSHRILTSLAEYSQRYIQQHHHHSRLKKEKEEDIPLKRPNKNQQKMNIQEDKNYLKNQPGLRCWGRAKFACHRGGVEHLLPPSLILQWDRQVFNHWGKAENPLLPKLTYWQSRGWRRGRKLSCIQDLLSPTNTRQSSAVGLEEE